MTDPLDDSTPVVLKEPRLVEEEVNVVKMPPVVDVTPTQIAAVQRRAIEAERKVEVQSTPLWFIFLRFLGAFCCGGALVALFFGAFKAAAVACASGLIILAVEQMSSD